MLKIFKRDKSAPAAEPAAPSLFARLTAGLRKTRNNFSHGLARIFLGKKQIDADLLTALETQLLLADVGVEATQAILQSLTESISRKQVADPAALFALLKEKLLAMLTPCEVPLIITDKKPFVILVVGVNGNGKTTTIGKLAKQFQQDGKQVLLAAGDTFRAAAIEQLQAWGERNAVPVIAQQAGADSASVIYDALQAAKARNIDIVLADTAGRLHTQQHLMAELSKIKRVISKFDDTAPHEVLLVLDAGTGQNAIQQIAQFKETVAISGLVLTKLDGTAKGGIIFALAQRFQLPLRYLGVGEGIADLRPFVATEFVEALFDLDPVEFDESCK